jgi:signal transduction histidine kinase
MKSTSIQSWLQRDILISVIVFAFLMVFTYGILFLAPYPGFYFNSTDGTVSTIYEDRASASGPHLQIGDVLKKVGTITFDEYSKDIRASFFQKYTSGDVIEIVIERNGETISIPWIYAGFTNAEFPSHFFNIWWLAYAFWLIGTATQVFMRPKDQRWVLFVAANYLTGMFIMLGGVSWTGFLESPILMRFVAWLLLPVYLHFHWIFPYSLRAVPRWVKFGFYALCGVLAILQLLLLLPNSLYFLAVILAFGGSILLLLVHYVLQHEYRRELGILAVAAFLSLGFTVVASIVASRGQTSSSAVASLFALPILPLTYFYILYRHHLGGSELRTNRVLSLYIFLVILGMLLLVTGSLGRITFRPQAFVFATVMIALITTFLGVQIFPAFQTFVERRLLGIKLPAQNMVEGYSSRIITSTTLAELLKLLEDEVFPSLLIRQYVFVRIANSSAKVILSGEVDQDQAPEDALMDISTSSSTGQLFPLSKDVQPLGWVRLILPLRVGSELIGAWLLGRRDPDDHYPPAELPILGSLANQTAIAVSNIVQTERLRLMYEANINRYEQERLRLGHELHDSLLNEMAAMLMKHNPDEFPREFQESFDGLILRLREIVQNLRPPMLVYGLKYALDGLADNLSERNHDLIQIIPELQTVEDCRYLETVEHNIYRIVQEACENALKYARAKAIRIAGELSPNTIDIHISDDGIGFKDDVSLLLDEMVVNKHYGLAGMHERAELIGAVIRIESRPSEGTQVHILWKAKDFI